MSLAFDSPSEFQCYDWEKVSPCEWQECFEDMVTRSKQASVVEIDCARDEVSKKSESDTILVESPLPSPKTQKQHKLYQLVLLQEVWARTGTNRDAFYQSLFLLQSMKLLDLEGLNPRLQNTVHTNESLYSSDPSIPHSSSSETNENWYDIVEKTISRLPNDIPLMMTAESPLNNLLSVLSKEVPNPASQQPQMQGKLVSLLKQSRFMTDFEPVAFIGKGGFGAVLKARNKSENLCYAIKVVRFRDFAVPSKRFQKVFREVTTLARLDHVNVVRYYSAWLELTEEYEDMLEHLTPSNRNGNETPSDSDSEESDLEEYTSDEFGVEDLLEDDMSSISMLVPYSEPFDDPSLQSSMIRVPRSQTDCSDDSDDSINIFGGGSVEIGFHGPQKQCTEVKRRQSMFSRPTLWRAESTSHIARPQLKKSMNSRNAITRSSTRRSKPRSRSKANTNTSPLISCQPITVQTSSNTQIHAKQFDYTLFIQMQLYEFDTLKHWLSNPKRTIDKKENLRIFSQIIHGLQHVHAHDLLHRDLKPANIFLSKDGTIKIGDFGLSRDLDAPTPTIKGNNSRPSFRNSRPFLFAEEERNSSGAKTFSVGTPGYVAPEILNMCDSYGPKVDVYSLGIILMELFTKTTTRHERAMNLMKLKDRILPSCIEHNFPEIGNLILAMTEPEPKKRISLDETADCVDFALDDFQHLRNQIVEQESKIKQQQVQIELLAQENAELKAKLAKYENRTTQM